MLTIIVRILIFFIPKQGNYCKTLKFDLHIEYQKQFMEFGPTSATTLGY
jgi:hypothetical protein